MSKQKPAHILQFFSYKGLPEPLLPVAEAFYAIADEMDNTLPECAEKSAGLRKLLEAKDCLLRAKLEEM